jgi:uncharacterized protein YkwD
MFSGSGIHGIRVYLFNRGFLSMRTWNRRAPGLVFLMLVLFVPFVWSQQPRGSTVERGLLESANRARREQGLPALKWDDALAGAARKHAELMAQQRTLSHQLSGEPSLPVRVGQVGVRHSWISENVAEGTSASDIHEQFMKSSNHRANILDSDMDTVGIGAVEAGGKWYAVEDFVKAK